MRSELWTPEKNALFIKHWPSASNEMLLKLFPGQTIKQLSMHSRNLRARGVNVPQRCRLNPDGNPYCRWTDEEISVLIKNWATASRKELQKLLPGRTMQQCVDMASKLRAKGVNVPYRRIEIGEDWSANDVQTLIKYWATLPEDELLAKFENKNRTMSACYTQAHKLRRAGVHIPTRSNTPNKQNRDIVAGVSYYKRDDAWCARISFGNITYCLGFRKDKNAAIALRKHAEEAIAPIRAELRQLSGVRTDPEFQKARSEIITRGHNILHTLSAQHKNK